MSVLPLAHAVYPDNYALSLDTSDTSRLLQARSSRTHISPVAERLHKISEFLFLPLRWNLQLLGRVIMPLPGANRHKPLLGLAIRVTALALWVLTIPFALVSAVVAFPLRLIDHRYRPALIYACNTASTGGKTKRDLLLTKEAPLHIRTHNLGLVTASFSTLGNLRSPVTRAHELVNSINNDPHKPDIIFFQEAFNEDACKVLFDGIDNEYPHRIKEVAPHIFGFNSGTGIASKYPIESAEFVAFNNMIGPERLAPRGIMKIRILSDKGPLLFYSIHALALMGEERSKIRTAQIESTRNLMARDIQREPNAIQVLLGDFNTARITPWGDDSLNPRGQAEEETLRYIQTHFDDVYLRDHDPVTGIRTEGQPMYLQADNTRLEEPQLVEPSGSWVHGPLADPGWIYSYKMRKDREYHGRPTPHKASITLKPDVWGTPKWHADQTANTSRFDYILLPKFRGITSLDGRAEIRRTFVPKTAQSASSDHLPVDARIWIAS